MHIFLNEAPGFIVHDRINSWCKKKKKKSSADYFSYCISFFTLKYVRYGCKIVCEQRFMCAVDASIHTLFCDNYRSVICSLCLDAVLHLWWKHPLAFSGVDSFHVWILALLVVVCRMCLEGREITISDFVKDNVLLTLGDCQKKVFCCLSMH